MAPRSTAARASVAAHPHQQGRWPPPEWFVRKFPSHGVPQNALAPAPVAPVICFNHTARKYRLIRLEALADGFETEVIEPAKRAQVRGVEGSVSSVEVFRMGSVRTAIIGRPRALPRHRRAQHFHTLDYEEPLVSQKRRLGSQISD